MHIVEYFALTSILLIHSTGNTLDGTKYFLEKFSSNMYKS